MRYFLDTDGGFTVVDDAQRLSAYAYPTSNAAQAAAKSDYHSRQIAVRLIANEHAVLPVCSLVIVEESYVRCAARLDAAGVREALEG
jgi:hypothetical protein